MAAEVKPGRMFGHVAVQMGHYVLVFGGGRYSEMYIALPLHTIWKYNLYTEWWSKHEIASWQRTPPVCYWACAVAIGSGVYMFDGRKWAGCSAADALWKLATTSEGNMFWSRIVISDKKNVPSQRRKHTGWEYKDKLWVFGGVAESPVGYLHDFGDFVGTCTNQLLCFDPSKPEWTNPKCTGSVPTPRAEHATTEVNDKVWLYGGSNEYTTCFDDLYALDKRSLLWTQIQTTQPKPQGKISCSLNAITEGKLVLDGGIPGKVLVPGFPLYNKSTPVSDTWILDLTTQSWEQYFPGTESKAHEHCNHTGITGFRNHVTIIGGNCLYATFHVMLEPRSLTRLAMQTIDKHHTLLPWESLPNKIIAQL